MHKQAVKLMHADLELDEDLAARARDEARLMSQLHHDHVVAVHALTKLEDRWAVFMEYVQGIDAGALLASSSGGLPPKVAVAMIERACAALDAAWNQPSPDTGRPLRVVHRDLKPANLMLSVEGSLKVMDFGVARADFDREAQTQSTQYGTGRYMAPERWLHIRAEHASDVYALGVTLYEMLSGLRFERMPLAPANFEKKLEEMLAAIPAQQDPQGRVTQVLRGMLAFEEEARPSAAQAMDALDELAEGLSGPSLRRYARAVVPPLLKERQQELLNDSVVWPGDGPITPTPGANSPAAAANSGPTAETRAEPSNPIAVAPAEKISGPEFFQDSQAEPRSEKSLLLPAIGGIGLGLALVAGALFWVAGDNSQTEPATPVDVAEFLSEPEPEVVLVEPPTAEAAQPEPEAETEPAPRQSRRSPKDVKPDPKPVGSSGDPVVNEPEPEKQTLVVQKEQPKAPVAKERFNVKVSADPLNGAVSYRGQSAGIFGTLTLEEGTHSLTWRWDDGTTLNCSVRAAEGKQVKFDMKSEKCK